MAQSVAAEPSDYCLRPLATEPTLLQWDQGAFTFPSEGRNILRSIPGLLPLVSIPGEGQVALYDPVTQARMLVADSPFGDFTSMLGPFDPETGRLYVWAYFDQGWVEVFRAGEGWEFGASEPVRPRLYDSEDDIDDVRPIDRSHALGVQIYSGVLSPVFGSARGYRFFVLKGEIQRRVPEAEALELRYAGDDPVNGRAVLISPRDPSRLHLLDHDYVWYDGTAIIAPTDDDIGPLLPVAGDPFGDGQILRDAQAQIFHWDGEILTPLAPTGLSDVFPFRSRPFFRAALGRWIIEGEDDWYVYSGAAPLQPLDMPDSVMQSHAWFEPPSEGAGGWFVSAGALFWELPLGAELWASAPEGWAIAGPADAGPLADGSGFAMEIVNRDLGVRYWYELTLNTLADPCIRPAELFVHAVARTVP